VSALEILAILAAGLAAGTINAVVGSGTLITFPVLLAFGFAPVTANVSNSLGLAPGALTGAVGYRRELAGQGRRSARLALATAIGAVGGAVLLLELPPSAFKAVVPAFILAALVLIVVQPRLSERLATRERDPHAPGALLWVVVLVTGVYGGYFGAAQGVILLSILAIGLGEGLQRANAVKNLLAGLANLVAGVIFAFAAPHVDWAVAGLLAVSSISGGIVGARYGRRLPPAGLRALIVAVAIIALVRLL
jgi:uncharacterized membrane protein YfcA